MIDPPSLVSDLKKISKLIEIKTEELDYLNYIKYNDIFNKAFLYLQHERVLLYGGYSLNEMLPSNMKLYGTTVLPDIDVMSPDAKKIAIGLVKYYKKYKHQAVSFSEALHKGTYKVFADGVQVVDITQCSETTYRRLKKMGHLTKKNIMSVPNIYIRMTLHTMMSQPNDASNRWLKVYKRLYLYYKNYPIKKCVMKSDKLNEECLHIVDTLYELLKNLNCVYFGTQEIAELTDSPILYNTYVPPIQIIIESGISTLIQSILQEIPILSSTIIYPADDFVFKHAILSFKKQPIMLIYETETCQSYNVYKKKYIASIHTIISILLAMYLSNYNHFNKMKPYLKCVSDFLSLFQQKSSKIRSELPLSCIGPSIGLITMRRNKMVRTKTAR